MWGKLCLLLAIIISITITLAQGQDTATKSQLSMPNTDPVRDLYIWTHNVSYCYLCIVHTAQKYCTVIGDYESSGHCCYNDQTSGYCSGSDKYICASSNWSVNNADMLLCPESKPECGQKRYFIDHGSQEFRIEKSIPNHDPCSYRLQIENEDIKNLSITVEYLRGGNVTIFTIPKHKFEVSLTHRLSEGQKATVVIPPSADVYILTSPSSWLDPYDVFFNISIQVGPEQEHDQQTGHDDQESTFNHFYEEIPFIVYIIVILVLLICIFITSCAAFYYLRKLINNPPHRFSSHNYSFSSSSSLEPPRIHQRCTSRPIFHEVVQEPLTDRIEMPERQSLKEPKRGRRIK
ncbi:unnamed protein product [Moneuplotes crassus]|uniref:Uncharacterized protein n=1 Tax=Euplotes crassus TaxID=5936 RepID=A0AAD1XB53_EUPCR|nr:unnamed protein product [Moneuplotes crassus]